MDTAAQGSLLPSPRRPGSEQASLGLVAALLLLVVAAANQSLIGIRSGILMHVPWLVAGPWQYMDPAIEQSIVNITCLGAVPLQGCCSLRRSSCGAHTICPLLATHAWGRRQPRDSGGLSPPWHRLWCCFSSASSW